ncbi:unnamed protein product [Meganyctiphanes norvegica]|uniref:RNA-binding protein NOB1 n=1 Tax=Meganyctiphanes norvegica TaxID=48144 RepID=A0AAV2PMP2_MEGNR
MKTKKIVVDSAAFVKYVPLWDLADELYSIPEVVGEIRDKTTRQRIESYPVPINLRQPQPKYISFINEFSKKTGDFASLSLADVKVLALAYEIEIETKGNSEHLRKEPQQVSTEYAKPRKIVLDSDSKTAGFYMPSEKGSPKISHNESCELSLELLNTHMGDNSYITGTQPTQADYLTHMHLQRMLHSSSEIQNTFVHLTRWFRHIDTFSPSEIDTLPTTDLSILMKFTPQELVTGKESVSADESESQTVSDNNSLTENVQKGLTENMQEVAITEEDTDIVCPPEELSEDSQEDQGFEDDSDEEGDNEGEENEEEEEDDDGWITPSNVAKHKKQKKIESVKPEELDEIVDVACITADFAMQNVLKHIGLNVMGVNGKIIHQLRTYILRCHACYKTTSLMDKVFCPKCGNKTLKKVSVTLNPDGTQHIWVNTKRAINTKGMKYSLPRPKGGKHAFNPILVADQREAQKLATKLGRSKTNPLHEDYDAGDSPFAVRDVYSRAAQMGYVGGKKQHNYYWEQRNPNESKKRIHKKK